MSEFVGDPFSSIAAEIVELTSETPSPAPGTDAADRLELLVQRARVRAARVGRPGPAPDVDGMIRLLEKVLLTGAAAAAVVELGRPTL